MAWVFKKTLLRGETPMLIMELPPYKRPLLRVVLRHMWDRSRLFLRRAGTVILGVNILLWFLATYPKSAEWRVTSDVNPATRNSSPGPAEMAGEQLRNSFAGWMGRAIEPVIAPLGFDWKMGIGIISSFAAREVFVSTMSTVYNVGSGTESEPGKKALVQTLRAQTRPDGSPLYTPLLAITLMVFYVFALQCASTVAVVRRETNSWRWPLFQWLYMGVLAWILAFVTWQGGHWLGWG
jgi:ferrous iron transport protein B